MTEPADRHLVAVAETLPTGVALDAGCGRGSLVVGLAQRGWTVTGIDRDADAIEAARVHAARVGVDARFEVADMTSWDPPRAYDLVLNSFAVPGADDRDAALATMVRAVAPGGTIAIIEWDRSMAARMPMVAADDLITIDLLVEALAGFEVQRAESLRGPSADEGAWEAVLVVATRSA